MTIERYTRRPTSDYSKGFLDVEFQNIQRAVGAVADVAIESVTAPLAYDPDTKTLSVGSTGGPTTAVRTSDVSNTLSGSANAVSTGLTVAVTTGESWAVRWVLYLKRNAGPAGASTLWLATIPSASKNALSVFAPTTAFSALTFATVNLVGTPALLASTIVNFDPGVQGAQVVVEMLVRNATSSATLDLKFGPVSGGDTVTIADGSHVIAQAL